MNSFGCLFQLRIDQLVIAQSLIGIAEQDDIFVFNDLVQFAVGDMADDLAAKAKDIIQDVKESEFADKVGDIAENIAEKAKEVGDRISGKE